MSSDAPVTDTAVTQPIPLIPASSTITPHAPLDADGLALAVGDMVLDYQGRQARVVTLAVHPAGAGRVVADIVYPGGLTWKVTTDRVRLAGDRKVVIVPCGARKMHNAVVAPAGQMYVGSFHAAARRAAERLAGRTGRVLILSAKYGLLDLGTLIEPYELRLDDPGAIPSAAIHRQARELGIDAETDVVILAPKAYGDLATLVWPHARRPLAGTRGIGEQLARLLTIAQRALLPADDGFTPPAPASFDEHVDQALAGVAPAPGEELLPPIAAGLLAGAAAADLTAPTPITTAGRVTWHDHAAALAALADGYLALALVMFQALGKLPVAEHELPAPWSDPLRPVLEHRVDDGDQARRRAEIDRIAAVLGVVPCTEHTDGLEARYVAQALFGPVTYRAVTRLDPPPGGEELLAGVDWEAARADHEADRIPPPPGDGMVASLAAPDLTLVGAR